MEDLSSLTEKELLLRKKAGFKRLEEERLSELRGKTSAQLFSEFLDIYSFGVDSLQHLAKFSVPISKDFDYENSNKRAQIFMRLMKCGH